MVDLPRAYRRWLAVRLALLVPSFLGAVGVDLWLVLSAPMALWVGISSISICAFISVLLGYFLVQTLGCFRLQSRGHWAAARPLRGQLAIHRPAAAASVAALAAIVVATLFFPEPTPPTSAPTRTSRRPAAESSVARIQQIPPEAAIAAAETAHSPPAPETDMGTADFPSALQLTERDFEVPILDPLPDLEKRRTARADATQEEWIPHFRPDAEAPFLPYERLDFLVMERPGLPDEGTGSAWMPPEIRLDFIYLNLEGSDRAAAAELIGDFPFARDESLRVAVFSAVFLDGEQLFEGTPEQTWQRMVFEYTRRLAGYSRHCTFDLAVSAGFSVDRFTAPEGVDPIDPNARLSPHVSADVAFWQRGSIGLLFHAGYSMPINLGGASSGVADASSVARIDVSERVSVHIGYRWMIVRLRDFEDPFTTGGSQMELAESCSGPLLGIDVRF